MVAAVRVHKAGGPEVLTFEDVDLPAPGPGQIRIKQGAIGINYIDTYFLRAPIRRRTAMPFIAGNEGSGDVVAVGSGVTDIKVGDRVAACRSAATRGAAHAGRPRREGAVEYQP